MRWQINSEESLYTDPWLDIRVAGVECPTAGIWTTG